MEQKTTDELYHEIQAAADAQDFLSVNAGQLLSGSLCGRLKALLEQKGLRRADVVRGAQLDRTYIYQIFSGTRKPSRDKLIAIAFGLKLSDGEAQKLLKESGYRELYAKDPRDALILYALTHGKGVLETNELLFSQGMATLEAPAKST